MSDAPDRRFETGEMAGRSQAALAAYDALGDASRPSKFN